MCAIMTEWDTEVVTHAKEFLTTFFSSEVYNK